MVYIKIKVAQRVMALLPRRVHCPLQPPTYAPISITNRWIKNQSVPNIFAVDSPIDQFADVDPESLPPISHLTKWIGDDQLVSDRTGDCNQEAIRPLLALRLTTFDLDSPCQICSLWVPAKILRVDPQDVMGPCTRTPQ